MLNALQTAGRAILSGLKTGEPKWVIPGMGFLCVAAIPIVNAPTGPPTLVDGAVTSCSSGTSRLQGYVRTICTVELTDGAMPSFEAAYPVPRGTLVAFTAVTRRFTGSYYEFAHYIPPKHLAPSEQPGRPPLQYREPWPSPLPPPAIVPPPQRFWPNFSSL